ncbi:MAG: hypothetical protein AAGA30_19990 [Planctomycetota bacterium]
MNPVEDMQSISLLRIQSVHTDWLKVNAILLAIYLGFFHACIDAQFATSVALGLIAWAAWTLVCFFNRSCFRNTFEYGIYQLVGLDLLVEGFIPFHSGYGFYFCAMSFWSVFLAYRFVAPMTILQRDIVENLSTCGEVVLPSE